MGLERWPYLVLCEVCGWGELTVAGRQRRKTGRMRAAELFEQKEDAEAMQRLIVPRASVTLSSCRFRW
ncbi:hypothetical protein AB0O67_01175 [Streptomyces sp. NPDC086077]|uniref:hypothetical protein n=1 Tax=Streptomyces sp. NPDC086077 TaxID=3154862 RepID=UPI0034185D07